MIYDSEYHEGIVAVEDGRKDGRGFMGFSLDGIKSPYWLKITNIDNSVLPSNNLTTQTINGRNGTIIQNSQLSAKEIKIDFMIDNQTCNFYMIDSYKKQLAGFLSPALNNEVELIIGTDTKIKYNAILTGEVDLKRVFDNGEGTITFYCADPIGIGDTIENKFNGSNNATAPMSVPYLGTAPTNPIVKFKLKKSITNFQLVANKEFVDVGEPMDVSTTQSTYSKWSISNPCESFGGISKLTGIDGAVATGKDFMVYRNYAFVPTTGEDALGDVKTYNGQGWYGSGYLFQGTRELENFRASCKLTINTSYYETVKETRTVSKPVTTTKTTTKIVNGKKVTKKEKVTTYKDVKETITKKVAVGKTTSRIQYELRDANNVTIAVVRLHDNRGSENGCWCDVFLNGVDGNPIQYIVKDKKLPTKYENFYGTAILQRKNNVWEFELNYDNSNGKNTRIMRARWTDGKKKYKRKPKNIAVSILRYNDKPYGTMRINHVKMEDLNKPPKEDNKAQVIARKGDEIIINNETGDIFLNGELWIDNINVASTFIELEPNTINGLLLSPSDITDTVTVEYIEKYY